MLGLGLLLFVPCGLVHVVEVEEAPVVHADAVYEEARSGTAVVTLLPL